MMKLGAMKVADGRSEVLKAVREQLFMGASQIKIKRLVAVHHQLLTLDTLRYTSDEMKAAVQAASDYGTCCCAFHFRCNAPSGRSGRDVFRTCDHHGRRYCEIIKENCWVIPSYFTSSLIAERKIPLPNEETYHQEKQNA
ncbi:hypothetical protein OK016_15260 [Vibrio chagasii]|nr:hypothetical protein [Vibrio chagasii]